MYFFIIGSSGGRWDFSGVGPLRDQACMEQNNGEKIILQYEITVFYSIGSSNAVGLGTIPYYSKHQNFSGTAREGRVNIYFGRYSSNGNQYPRNTIYLHSKYEDAFYKAFDKKYSRFDYNNITLPEGR